MSEFARESLAGIWRKNVEARIFGRLAWLGFNPLDRPSRDRAARASPLRARPSSAAIARQSQAFDPELRKRAPLIRSPPFPWSALVHSDPQRHAGPHAHRSFLSRNKPAPTMRCPPMQNLSALRASLVCLPWPNLRRCPFPCRIPWSDLVCQCRVAKCPSFPTPSIIRVHPWLKTPRL